MSAPPCRICGATISASIVAREMMFGLRDEFTYDECGTCGCVQLRTPPSDWARFYPATYHSLLPVVGRGRLWNIVRRARNVLMYRNPMGLGRLMAGILAKLPADKVEWLAHTQTRCDARILDVGSGSGLLVRDLADAGFTSVLGIDPFIEAAIQVRPGVKVEPAILREVTGEFDLIMFHHSLEHIRDQLGSLRRAAQLLAPHGWCLVRVPLSSYAWHLYREHWVQLDAPRHHFLHTVSSMSHLAAAAGLRVDRVVHDSTGMQFWGSEAYKRGVALSDAMSLFTPAELREYDRRARDLNAQGQGDQACFYLRRA